MWASHESLRDDYAVSTRELDAFVTVARQAGALGARLTGAGFGGCAIALIEKSKVRMLTERVTAAFAQQGYHAPMWYEFTPAAGAEVVR